MSAKIKNKSARPPPELRPRSAPIIERAPLPIVEVQGSNHLVTYVNSAFCSLLEKPRVDLIGKPFCEIVPGGDECVPILDRVYQTGEAATLAKKDEAELAHWLFAMWPALDEEERPVGVIIQLTKADKFRRDMTEVNEALLIASLRQHEMRAEAEHLNAQVLESQKETQRARDYAEATLRTAPIPLIILNADLRVNTTNEAFCKTFQVEPGEAEGQLIYDLGNRQWNIPKLRELLEDILPKNKIFTDYEVTHDFESIGRRTMLLNARRMENEIGQPLRIVLAIEDITQRKLAEEELRESERETKRALDYAEATLRTAPVPLLILNADLRVNTTNEAFSNTFQVEPGEAEGQLIYDLGNRQWNIPKLRELLEDILPKNKIFTDYEVTHEFETIGRRTMLLNARRMENEIGQPLRIVLAIEDITQRKLAEEALSEKARLLDLSNDAIIVRDFEGRMLYWNHGAEELYGWSRKEALGKNIHSLLQTEFPKPLEQITEELNRNDHWTGEMVQTKRDGQRITVLGRKALDRDSQGNPAGVLESITDISERIAAREALRESEERYRNLFTSIDEGFCVFEMIFDEHEKPVDFLYLEVNPSFEKQTGIKEATGKRILELVPTFEAYWIENFGRVALTGEPIRFVNEAKGLNSWFDVYAFRIGGGDSRKVAVIFNNITHRIRNEETLRLARAQIDFYAAHLEKEVAQRTGDLKDTNEQLAAFVYSIAHDLRAPLRSMQGFSQLLMDDYGPSLDENARSFLKRINASSEFMDKMIMDLLAFGAAGKGAAESELRPVKVQAAWDGALYQYATEIERTKTQIETVAPLPSVRANEATLTQALANLLSNAIKFVPEGVQPKIRFWAEDRGEMVRLWIQDNGVGISTIHQERIFRVFERLNGARFAGTGIGLSIVRKGIERMGGKVGLESDLGKGTKLWIELQKANF